MNSRQGILLSVIAAFTLGLTACGGSSTPAPPAVTVTLSGQPASLSTSATASITATVSNGTSVNWTVTCAASPCGSFNPASTASGAATVYTAPAAPTSVNITATTSSGTAASSSATITISAPPISVTFSPAPPSSLAISANSPLTAVVANDTKNAGVTWTVTCSNSPCGSFSATTTASGTATVYTAPSTVPTSGTVMVTATSVTDTTKFASATITITAPGISVALNPPPPTSLATSANASLTAIVSNDSKNAGVTWSVTCGSSACGSFNPTSTASGTATAYTAPTAVPTSNTVTVTATSVTDTTKFASAMITIVVPAPILADGNYVYHFSGWDNSGPSFVVGAFNVKSGAITAGEQDFTDASIRSNDQLVASGSSLSLAGSNIQIVLATANTSIGINGIETLHGTVVSTTRVLISEFDTFGTGTGSIDVQTGTAAPSGGYAFAISGWDLSSPVNPLAIGGVLNISGTSLSTSNSVFDFNLNGGLIGQSETFASGTVTTPDSFGRVSFALTPSAASGVPQFTLNGYIVGTNQIQLVEGAGDLLADDLGGTALGQGSNTALFTQASVSSKTYVYEGAGQDVNNLVTLGGSFTFNANATVSGSLALNDGNVFGTNPISAGNYAVDPTGRVTLTGVTVPALGSSAVFTFQLYLDGNGNALELGIDTIQTTQGQAYLQATTTADFEGSYALQGQGILNATNLPAFGAVGPVTVASDAFTGSTDYTAQTTTTGATATAAQALTGTETSSTTMLSLTGLDSTALTTARGYSYFPIDTKRVLAIEIDGQQLGILTLESTAH